MAAIDYQVLQGKVGELFSQTPSVTQPVRLWEAVGMPEGFSINATTGLITGTPEEAINNLPGYRLPVSIRTIDAVFIEKIAANGGYSVGLTSDGKVLNSGISNVDSQQNYDLVASLSGITEIAAGPVHTLALRANGTVVGWLNTNADDIFWDHDQHIPPAGLSGVTKIAAGRGHSLALKSNGTVVGWGFNGSGAATPPAGLTGVVDIACGWQHSVALKSNGTVVTWGGEYPATPANLTGVTAIASTARSPSSHTLALKSNGTVVAWGLPDTNPRLQVPSNLTGVIGIAAGPDYSLAWKADGTLVRFGIEDPTANLPDAPTSIPGIIAAAIGNSFFIALKNNGIVDGYGGSTDIPGSSYGDAKFLPPKEARTIFFAFSVGVPVIQPNQTFTGKVGTALNAQLVFSNTMHRPVTSVSATGLPSWATINDRSIIGTPTDSGSSTVTLTPDGPAGTGPATTATLSISGPPGAPIITSGQSFNGRVGQSFSSTPELTNASGRPATSWSATGLPAGLTINATTGVISGTPTSSGSITASLTASSSAGSSGATTVQFVIAVAMTLPVITSGQSFSAIVGYTQNWIQYSDPFSEYIALTVETYRSETSWAIASGVLPTGLTLNATTGEISGTTIATGIFTVSVVASNSIGASVPKQIVITIFDGIPRIQQGKTYLGRVGVAFSATPTLNDVEFAPAVSWSATGLPSWASINNTTGVITGTPDVSGKTDFQHRANGLRAEVGVLTHIDIGSGAPSITSGQSFTGVVGEAFSRTPTLEDATNRPATSWTATSLPAGLSINASTGLITGTPTTVATATASLTATGAGGSSPATDLLFGISAGKPLITAGQSASGIVGAAFSKTFSLTNSTNRPATSWAATGLPSWATLNTTTGAITGTPQDTGSATISLTATGPGGTSAATTATISIAVGPPTIVAGQSFTGKVGMTFTSATLTLDDALDRPATSWSATGLPAGLSLNATTGAITGTPTAEGSFTATITATGPGGTDSETILFSILSVIPIFAGAIRATAVYAGAVAAKALYYGAKKLWPPPR